MSHALPPSGPNMPNEAEFNNQLSEAKEKMKVMRMGKMRGANRGKMMDVMKHK